MSIVASGSMRAGKSYLLEVLLDLDIKNVPDPMYAITEYCFGTRDKSVPGVREFMQRIGQIGRGLIDEEYPASFGRAALTNQIRSYGSGMMEMCADNPEEYKNVDWNEFGRNPDFWVDVLANRVEKAIESSPVTGRERSEVGIPNARFPNEIIKMTELGLDYYHVMCSRGTRRARVEGDLEEQESDRTEQLGKELNALALKKESVLTQVHEESGEYEMLEILNDEVPLLLDRIAFGEGVVWSDPHREVPRNCNFLTPADLESRYE